jgi:predicted AlkP superfamily phosphohydrolase/phosphomutase
VIVSDHGFGGTGDRAISINRQLNHSGLLGFKSQPGAASQSARILKQAGLHLVPASVQQHLFRRWGGVVNALESGARFGHIDWSHTLAYSEELNYFPSVWINLRGREPGGIVDPRDYESTRDRVITALYDWVDAESGQPIVARAHRREDLYTGPAVGSAPDIVIELALDRGYSYAVEAARAPGRSIRRLDRSEFIGAKGRSMNGSHRSHGVLIAAGPSIAPGRRIASPSLADLAPSLLALLGLPSDDMDGRVLTELIDGNDSGHRHAPIEPDWLNWAPQPELTYSRADEAVLAGRLRSLGYIE